MKIVVFTKELKSLIKRMSVIDFAGTFNVDGKALYIMSYRDDWNCIVTGKCYIIHQEGDWQHNIRVPYAIVSRQLQNSAMTTIEIKENQGNMNHTMTLKQNDVEYSISVLQCALEQSDLKPEGVLQQCCIINISAVSLFCSGIGSEINLCLCPNTIYLEDCDRKLILEPMHNISIALQNYKIRTVPECISAIKLLFDTQFVQLRKFQNMIVFENRDYTLKIKLD